MSVLEIEGSFEGKTTIKLSTPLPLAWHLLREIHCSPFWLWNKGEVLFPAPEEMFKTCLFLWIKDQSLYPNQFSTVSWFYVSKDNCGWRATEKCYNSVLWKWKHLLAFTDFEVLCVSILAGVAWASPASLSLACQGLPWGQMDLWFSCREGGTVQHPLRASVHGDRTRRPGWWAPRPAVLKGHGLTPDPRMPKWESGVVVYGVP